MDGDEADIPDTTALRQALAPQLLPQFARILAHAQEVRAWATQASVLSDTERQALLEQLSGLEQVAAALAEHYAKLMSPVPPPPDASGVS